MDIPPPRPKRKPSHPYPRKASGSAAGDPTLSTELPDFTNLSNPSPPNSCEAAVAAVAAAASAAAAAAAAAVIAAAGEQVQAQLQVRDIRLARSVVCVGRQQKSLSSMCMQC